MVATARFTICVYVILSDCKGSKQPSNDVWNFPKDVVIIKICIEQVVSSGAPRQFHKFLLRFKCWWSNCCEFNKVIIFKEVAVCWMINTVAWECWVANVSIVVCSVPQGQPEIKKIFKYLKFSTTYQTFFRRHISSAKREALFWKVKRSRDGTGRYR